MPATDNFFRDLKGMHVVFAVSAVALFGVTIWMLAVDHSEEWHDYQKAQFRIDAERLQRASKEVKTPEYNAAIKQLNENKSQAEARLEEQGAELGELQSELASLDRNLDLANRETKDRRQYRDVARANYDLGINVQADEETLAGYKKAFEEQKSLVDAAELDLQQKQSAYDEALFRLKQEQSETEEIEANLKQLTADSDRIRKALNVIQPENKFSSFKRNMMEWPIIDGFNSHLRIQQDWLPDLKIKLGMAETARFDRCRTCHQSVDVVEAGNVPAFPFGHPSSDSIGSWFDEKAFPLPFATHPNPALYLTAASPHPVARFGCTICHEGQGSGTDFSNAAHYPNDPYQHEEWEHEFGFATNHYWEYPMLPKRFEESSCLKCHHTVVELGVNPTFGASAPKVYDGFQLVRQFGCFGCHQINGFQGNVSIGPDIRLEPAAEAEAKIVADDPGRVAGTMRKVGPALRHIESKTTPSFVEYWTEEPKRFRPATRMPQFFGLTNQHDEVAKRLQPVEIAALTQYLFAKSEPLELMRPAEAYQPDAARGKTLFSMRGCLACHSDRSQPELTADFGPDLSHVNAKIKPGAEGYLWLYTWLKDPTKHHPRTRMPNLFLEPYEENGAQIDPAADIAAFLLEPDTKEQPHGFHHGAPTAFSTSADTPAAEKQQIAERTEALDELVKLYLRGTLTESEIEQTYAAKKIVRSLDQLSGDEVELAVEKDHGNVSDAQWTQMKLNYVGRRTISRYGCYGCHDIPGFETARPIGTALQDWGRKDTSKLALEHIEEFLHHHGEADGSSTLERVKSAMTKTQGGGTAAGQFVSEEQEERERTTAYFFDSLLHHGRPGFLWQKLRQPRSYDYMKTGTKRYDERLRMPKFPLSEPQIEAIATFVLGLVAEPPASEYLYQPEGAALARNEGELLLDKYNCTGCHMIDLPEIRYGVDPESLMASKLAAGDFPEGLELLHQLKPQQSADTGETMEVSVDGEASTLPVIRFRGLIASRPDPLDDLVDQEFTYDLWEPLKVGDKQLNPATRMIVPKTQLAPGSTGQNGYAKQARGGHFTEWLVDQLMETTTGNNRNLAWQMAPPPLYKEGIKVQTPWLYQFLRDPGRIRHTTVLRMPRFNMSSDEAQKLADYFAAVDDARYPYQRIPQREPDYLAARNQELHAQLEQQGTTYLEESWKLLNAPLCIKCHSLGGREVKISDPKKDIRGPNLELATERLRPDWTLLWLYKPVWLTPYTSMPTNLPRGQKQFTEFFHGDAGLQTKAIRDALMNYNRLMEQQGKVVTDTSTPTANAGGGE